MNEIWANRLIAGDKKWDEVPETRKNAVLEVLAGRVADDVITKEQYKKITGKTYASKA